MLCVSSRTLAAHALCQQPFDGCIKYAKLPHLNDSPDSTKGQASYIAQGPVYIVTLLARYEVS